MPQRISGFLDQYQPSTKNGYQSGIVAFLSFIYNFERKGKRISDSERKQMELLADKYFLDQRDYEKDLIAFSKYCSDNGLASTTKSYYVTGIREFYIYNDVEMTIKQERNLRNKITRGDPVSEEEELDKEMIRKILNSADLKLKTLIMVLISSGMRLGEALSLTDNDIQLYPDHGIIRLKGNKTKSGSSRITFINKEAVELLQQWLAQRGGYIKYITGRSRGRFEPKAAKDKIFPFGKNNAENCFRRLLKNSGMLRKDRDTHRASIHYHLFRKYFVTNISYSGIDSKYVDFFVGHSNRLTKTYNKPTIQKFYEFYMKGEPYLRIFDDSIEEITSLKDDLNKNKEVLTELKLDNINMRLKLQDVEKIEKELLEMKSIMNQLTITQDHKLHRKGQVIEGIGTQTSYS